MGPNNPQIKIEEKVEVNKDSSSTTGKAEDEDGRDLRRGRVRQRDHGKEDGKEGEEGP